LTEDEVRGMIVRWASLLLYLALRSSPLLRIGMALGGSIAAYCLVRLILSGRRQAPDSEDTEG
jgi:hypothetical protein